MVLRSVASDFFGEDRRRLEMRADFFEKGLRQCSSASSSTLLLSAKPLADWSQAVADRSKN
mgnify:CR=1 FL=1